MERQLLGCVFGQNTTRGGGRSFFLPSYLPDLSKILQNHDTNVLIYFDILNIIDEEFREILTTKITKLIEKTTEFAKKMFSENLKKLPGKW